MNMNWKLKTLTAATLAVVMAGCAHNKAPETPVQPTTPPVQQQPAQPQDQGAQTSAADNQAALDAQRLADEKARADRAKADLAAQLNVTTFYFDYDSNAIQSSDYDSLKAHAAYLAKNPNAKVRVEGNADERGTREYNMALGERRAKAVAAFLTSNGASAGQLNVVSFGKEKPAVDGHDEAAWSKNRRVELHYTDGQP